VLDVAAVGHAILSFLSTMPSSDDRGPTAKPGPDPERDVAPAPLRRTGYGQTDLGRKRATNEDAFFVDDELGLYVVADGMGGHAAGEVASREAVDTLYGMVKRGVRGLRELSGPVSEADSSAACRLMEAAVQAATYFVYSIAEIDRDKSGMGTTISALLVLGDHAVTAQVGDSRIYRVDGDAIEQLTEDHTLIAWQLKQGLITPQEAARSPHRNVITRAVGNREYVQVDTRCIPLAPGLRFLLCSDGLHGYLRDDDIPSIVSMGGAVGVERFIELANERGGKDNITAVLVEID
jgi:serine/threonine protein phosphatase PrpC